MLLKKSRNELKPQGIPVRRCVSHCKFSTFLKAKTASGVTVKCKLHV